MALDHAGNLERYLDNLEAEREEAEENYDPDIYPQDDDDLGVDPDDDNDWDDDDDFHDDDYDEDDFDWVDHNYDFGTEPSEFDEDELF